MHRKVVLLKKFNQAAIEVRIDDSEIGISIELVDFINLIAEKASVKLADDAAAHAGNPALLMTNEMLKRKLEEAIDPQDVFNTLWSASMDVLSEMKKASVVAQ